MTPPLRRQAKAALVAAFVVLAPGAAAQPRDAYIAGGHAFTTRPGPYQCNHASTQWTPRENRCVVRRVFPRSLWRQAFAIIGCESQWNERVISRTGDYGLFQINRNAHPDAFGSRSMLDPVTNTKYARRLHQLGGWRAWTCSRILGIN